MQPQSTITAYLMGGLGNQMFQVAAAFVLALKNKAKCVIPSGPDQRMTRKTAYTHTIFSRIPVLNVPLQFLAYNEPCHCYSPLPENIDCSKNVVLCGYYQSPKYFLEYDEQIRELFAPTPEIEAVITEKKWNFENSLAIHVRRGDYLQLSNTHPPLPIQWYQRALETVGSKFETVYIFSDDIAWCRGQSIFQELNPIYVQEPDYISLHIMSKCSAHIIANSTFSWWGAYLARETRKVVYPRQWFGPDGPATFKLEDLIPGENTRWIGIN